MSGETLKLDIIEEHFYILLDVPSCRVILGKNVGIFYR